MAEPPVLEARNLSISYYTRAGEIPAVIDFSVEVHAGETIGIVGESGCGKSTVAMAIMQHMGTNGAIVGGQVLYKGRDMAEMSQEELRKTRGSEIAMIYQEPFASLNPSLKIRQQLMEIPLTHEGASESEARDRALQILRDVQLPDPERVMEAFPHQLSGGQQQRVVIAMGLLANASLLVLDEPTTALDVTVEAGIIKLIGDISRRFGTAQIYISHNLGLIRETCDRVFVMYSGEVVEEGSIDQLFRNPRHPYTHGLFGCIASPSMDKNATPLKPIRGQLPLPHERPPGCNFGPRCDFFKAGRCDQDTIPHRRVDEQRGHYARCVRIEEIKHDQAESKPEQKDPLTLGEVVLKIDRMQKYYPVYNNSIPAILRGERVRHVKANESLTFNARRAETVAIVGESGCGKSTFAKVLMGLETATGGSIKLEDTEIAYQPVRKRPPDRISALQMVFQNPFDTLNPSHRVGPQIGRVIQRFTNARSQDRIRDKVFELLDIVKLPRDFYYRRPRQLSGGQKQRVGIARAFAGNPAMVVADEPVSALDVSVAAAVTELLMDIQREHHTTLLFISHDLSTVRYLSDSVVVMYLGWIMERGTTDEVFSPPYNPYTEALLSAVPIADPNIQKREILLEGNLPSVMAPPKGCPFSTRCPHRIGEICDNEPPPEREVSPGHTITCHIPIEELKRAKPVFEYHEPASESVG